MKKFNTTAVCIPSKHYMVDITDRVKKIKKLVDYGEYFTINRARQYGKTTTLLALKHVLIDEYNVVSLSFDGITHANFETEKTFVKALCRMLKNDQSIYEIMPQEIRGQIDEYIDRKEEHGLSLHPSSSRQEDHSATDMLPLSHTLFLPKAGRGGG